MRRRTVALDVLAKRDLDGIHAWITEHTGRRAADRYLRRIQRFLSTFETGAEHGTSRSDINPGLRTVGFERSITVIFYVTEHEVAILRVLYGGRDIEAALDRTRERF